MSKSKKYVAKVSDGAGKGPCHGISPDEIKLLLEIFNLRNQMIFSPARKIMIQPSINAIERKMSFKPDQIIECLETLLPEIKIDSYGSLSSAFDKYTKIFKVTENEPCKLSKNRWFYHGEVYITEGNINDDQFRLLIMEEVDQERKYWERLKRRHSKSDRGETTNKRLGVKEAVRIEVWRRDGGKCARCGTRENLEYDHIIPVSKGGSNTARNIELLCEKCNRQKGVKIE